MTTPEKEPLPWRLLPRNISKIPVDGEVVWDEWAYEVPESQARALFESGKRVLSQFEWSYKEDDGREVISVPFHRNYLKQLIDLLRSVVEEKK